MDIAKTILGKLPLLVGVDHPTRLPATLISKRAVDYPQRQLPLCFVLDADNKGDISESRMLRMGGDFTVLMRCSAPRPVG